MAQKRSATKQAPAKKPSRTNAKSIPIGKLLLNPDNPRLTGQSFNLSDQDGILKYLWENYAVDEIVDSISISGYWQHEVIFAKPEGDHLVVIEGNRRLAAAKLLHDASLREKIGAKSVPSVKDSFILDSITELPVIETEEVDLWAYVGFKHLNGPQSWESIAKAEFIAYVYEKNKDVSLDEIARNIGDRNITVRRLYRGLSVLKQAEAEGLFNRNDCYNPKFPFSHLMTGLGYTSIQEFLGLMKSGEYKPNPIPKTKKYLENLGLLCQWLFGNRDEELKPLVEKQNPHLKELAQTLENKRGIAALRAGLPLKSSLDQTRGKTALLRDALIKGENALREANGYVPDGFTEDDDAALEVAESIYKLANSIFNEMNSKVKSRRNVNKD